MKNWTPVDLFHAARSQDPATSEAAKAIIQERWATPALFCLALAGKDTERVTAFVRKGKK